ncbi:unnamed protein product, partial [Amoebophrya sp. A120]
AQVVIAALAVEQVQAPLLALLPFRRKITVVARSHLQVALARRMDRKLPVALGRRQTRGHMTFG